MLIAQIDDQRGCAVEERQHSDTHVKLRGGRIVSSQEVISGGSLVDNAVGDLVWMIHQPVYDQRTTPRDLLQVKGRRPCAFCLNVPEGVVKMCLYFFVFTSLAGDVDAAQAAVASSCCKGEYGKQL